MTSGNRLQFDMKRITTPLLIHLLGGVLFLALYTIFLLGLKWSAPGYIEQVWNLKALSGIVINSLLIEELMFGFAFGLVWTGLYEHFTWRRSIAG